MVEEQQGNECLITLMKNKVVEHQVLLMKLWGLIIRIIKFCLNGLFKIKINIGRMLCKIQIKFNFKLIFLLKKHNNF